MCKVVFICKRKIDKSLGILKIGQGKVTESKETSKLGHCRNPVFILKSLQVEMFTNMSLNLNDN